MVATHFVATCKKTIIPPKSMSRETRISFNTLNASPLPQKIVKEGALSLVKLKEL